jgi:phosphatidylserine decarboxylase
MTLLRTIAIVVQERLNFLLTNRVPRRAFTLIFGWFSKLQTSWMRDLSITLWKLFSDLDLSDAKKSEFVSLHDCFTRELRAGARPVVDDPQIITSPCDAIVGAFGTINGITAIQAKGFSYSLQELLHDPRLVTLYRGGSFLTLRLTATMYHRFHAPHCCQINQVTYIAGDTWNVNPIALRRIEKLFCRNERVVIPCELTKSGITLTLVPVAAILVASIRLHFLNVLLHLRYRGPNIIGCSAKFEKGEEMGWFEHGSTIIVFAPLGVAIDARLYTGQRIKVGESLCVIPRKSEHDEIGVKGGTAAIT